MNKEGRIPGPTEENMDGIGNTQVSWHDTGLHMLHILSQRRAGLITSKCKHYDLFSNIRELIFYKLPKKIHDLPTQLPGWYTRHLYLL